MAAMSYEYKGVLLKVENLSLSFGDKQVLADVNAEIKDLVVEGRVTGQVVGFLGPSGCGKTTLFRIIAGLLPATAGKVTINGDHNVRVGDVGVVAQNYPLFENRTVLSNLMLAAGQKEKDVKVATAKVDEYLAQFDLWDRRHAYPAELSGGQRQRTSILQQIVCSQHFLLLDEPFSGLDMLMVEKTSKLIQAVADMDELNTIIICTHDISAAAAVSDHLWLMGRDRDAEGKARGGARIVETYDLAARDLCWHPEIMTQPAFTDFVREVRERFRTL